ncbi:MAG: dihydroorotate dehydrogenase electron transfer subunit [candidate division KSB1 bacterium]|nr:dihydroorotate dehydrogenase electron transfer subunit [candidate division KSB1 bacterium]
MPETQATRVPPRIELCQVVHKEEVADSIFRLTLASERLSRVAQPGNFVNIRVNPSYFPLWRRPFSFHDARPGKGEWDVLFQVVGEGTRLLSQAKEGDFLDVLGPLGNSFPLPPRGTPAVLLAGGLGIAPLLLLSRCLAENGSPVTLLYGARGREKLVSLRSFQELGVNLLVSTEDGSVGMRGTLADLVQQALGSWSPAVWIYVCGPLAALQAVRRALPPRFSHVWVSLETAMACGFGACVGCAVKARRRNGYLLVCKDGPVFSLDEVEL